MRELSRIYVGGAWADASTAARTEVVNPTTEQVIALVPEGTAEDVDRAVSAARRAAPAMAALDVKRRAQALRSLAGKLQESRDELAATITDEVGTPIRISQRIQAALPVTILNGYADLIEAGLPQERIGNSLVLREPVGVVAAITPWNYPLHQIVCKLAPALAAGCPIVIKPSEVAPLTAYALFDALHELGLPAGAVNLVPGTGNEVGEPLVRHPDVDAVSFTGSLRAGRRVGELAAATVKRVTLELGGKSANVVLDDADLATAVKVGVSNAFLNGGQTCTAWTRLLVPRRRLDEAMAAAVRAAEGFVPADPRDPATRLGPMATATQRDTVRGHIVRAVADGQTPATGGPETPEGLDSGYFVRPTVFADVDPDSALAQEEIFGPVLAILAHDGDDHAIEIANNSRYGLHGAVWSADEDRALTVAKRLRTGSVDINGGAYNPLAPFGGYKQSGVGRELGRHGLEEFLETKSVQI
ncbi:aldehyde dehydrogenase family protein [Streptomyces sp. NPDC004838]